MALHAVLGVLSNAIRCTSSPDEVAAIIAAAPELSDAERIDLQCIPFERLAPYQHDVYMADRNMLVWGFTNTWTCLQQLQFRNEGWAGGNSERMFVLNLKRKFPCATHSVRELGALFVKYLRTEYADLCSKHPWLAELAEAERLEVEVLYAMDNMVGRPLDAAARVEFFERPIGDLLSAQLVRAEAVHVGCYRYDIPAIKRAITGAEGENLIDFRSPPFIPADSPMHFAIARDHKTLEPVWYVADAADAAFVAALSEHQPLAIETHAESVLHAIVPAKAPDAALLAQYLFRLERALRLRYCLVA